MLNLFKLGPGCMMVILLVSACASSDASATPIPSATMTALEKEVVVTTMLAQAGIREADFKQEGQDFTLVIIVEWNIGEEQAKDFSDNFVRLLKTHGPDTSVESGSRIGKGGYNYHVGVFRPDGTTNVVEGEKYDFADNINWFD
ncbi:MAG: hypothetical protein V3U79_07390 [Dehalococcoidia bacterium]